MALLVATGAVIVGGGCGEEPLPPDDGGTGHPTTGTVSTESAPVEDKRYMKFIPTEVQNGDMRISTSKLGEDGLPAPGSLMDESDMDRAGSKAYIRYVYGGDETPSKPHQYRIELYVHRQSDSKIYVAKQMTCWTGDLPPAVTEFPGKPSGVSNDDWLEQNEC